jgi:hypothetical protein
LISNSIPFSKNTRLNISFKLLNSVSWLKEYLELIPVKLNPDTEVEFAFQIVGYVISYPLDSVDRIEDLLKV